MTITYDCGIRAEKRPGFISNAIYINALEVALLCNNRWSVELFFKWVKQNLRIK